MKFERKPKWNKLLFTNERPDVGISLRYTINITLNIRTISVASKEEHNPRRQLTIFFYIVTSERSFSIVRRVSTVRPPTTIFWAERRARFPRTTSVTFLRDARGVAGRCVCRRFCPHRTSFYIYKFFAIGLLTNR